MHGGRGRGRGRGRGQGRGQGQDDRLSLLAQGKAVTTAVVVIPPESMWDGIQAIRQKYDKAYERWMPHINLSFPFVPEEQFPDAVSKLEKAFGKQTQHFTVTLNKFDFFKHSKSCTLFLDPVTDPAGGLHNVQKILEEEFPNCNNQSTKSPSGFHPHLTLGQWPTPAETCRVMDEFQLNWKTLQFVCTHIAIICRTHTTPFQVKHLIPLGPPANTSDTQGATTTTTTTTSSSSKQT